MAFPRSFGQLIDKYIDKLCRTNNKNIGNKKWRDNRQELGRWWENHRFAISFPIKIKKHPAKNWPDSARHSWVSSLRALQMLKLSVDLESQYLPQVSCG
jgi:hypothetical protein